VNGLPLISLMLAMPVLGVLGVLVGGGRDGVGARLIAVMASAVTLAMSLVLWVGYDPAGARFQFEERVPWLPDMGISYHVGLDGISLLLVLLTTVFVPLALTASMSTITTRLREFAALVLLLQFAILGALVSLDLFVFYVFFELMLVPTFLLIGVWGGERRVSAAMRFFLFTMVGSVAMLVGMIALGTSLGTFDYVDLTKVLTKPGAALSSEMTMWLFVAFTLAFAIKVPLVPVHSWLPEAYVEAPVPVTVLMSSVMAKVGTYGFLRFSIGLFPSAAQEAAWAIAVMATLGIVYAALVAAKQRDLKRLLAYSSISHLGFVVLGLVAGTIEALQGSVLQMVNHGVSTGALFLMAGMLNERARTWVIAQFGGVARAMPVFGAVLVLVTFSSAGLPFTNGFTGEFLILTGAFRSPSTHLWPFAIVGASGIVLGAMYLLRMYQRVLQGPVNPSFVVASNNGQVTFTLSDLTSREVLILAPLAVLIMWIGVYPKPFLDRSAPAVRAITAPFAGAAR
jgi:NADH-quinone oxidoreductase subunit M